MVVVQPTADAVLVSIAYNNYKQNQAKEGPPNKTEHMKNPPSHNTTIAILLLTYYPTVDKRKEKHYSVLYS